ncbi:hypothetical protein BD779DRAFT_1439595 [Infundibulicybe gibba]|nr:hypothetical protein BD779DRAFT_1439595 [Infundibulicybe gibba]
MPSILPGPKRFRPPNINLTLASEKRGPAIELEAESPIDLSDDEESEDTLQLSSDSSPSTSPIVPILKFRSTEGDDGVSDDISKDLAALEELRRSVQKNLRLRPIRSHGALPKVNLSKDVLLKSPFLPSSVTSPRQLDTQNVPSPASTTTPEIYYTPLSDLPPSARYLGSDFPRAAAGPPQTSPHPSRPISPGVLFTRLTSLKRPLLIDTRPPAIHLSFHIKSSINIAIPSLILKRCRKPGGGFQSLDTLRQFVTTEQGKAGWDELMCPGGPWDGDVIIYDDEMDIRDRDNVGITAWALLPVLMPLLSHGSVDYLDGGISAGGHDPDLETLIVSGADDDDAPASAPSQSKKAGGLFQLDIETAYRSQALPEIEASSATSSAAPSPRSPLPMMPSAISSTRHHIQKPNDSGISIADASPSPPPSQITFRRPVPPQRRPSVPNLRRIDTTSTERLNPNLPKLSVRTKPMRSATLTVPPSLNLSLHPPTSPSHLTLFHSNHSPPGSARWTPSSPNSQSDFLKTPYYTPPHTPGTPKPILPPSPSTARPSPADFDPPTTEESFPVFTISTILPNFLFLGPELTTPEHVKELKGLGVRRILNIAAECDDDHGLFLRDVFEKYVKIPMRDTVEEDGIAKGVREVCEILDDARLHSAPTYVHCKAGKSRSVTAVMAYLIHANHWTLSRAYSFVLERRKGISPNIGFVSELMAFEEEELGGKSVGVQPSAPAGAEDSGHGESYGHSNYSVAAGGGRRGAHVRESLPPVFVSTQSAVDVSSGAGGSSGVPMSAGGVMDARVVGDSGEKMEIKDSSGRYRHARRAPVDENTLQPMRRVSKAGLESSAYA